MVERVSERVRAAVSELSPGYFAVVMATGVITVGMKLENHVQLSYVLFGIAAAAFVLLLALNGWRLAVYRGRVAADFRDPRQAFGFFTVVAGANVLGACLAIDGMYRWAAGILVGATIGWVLLGYAVPWAAVLGRVDRQAIGVVNGTWFMWVVASQSVAVLAATLEPHLYAVHHGLAVLAVAAWSLGVLLYCLQGALVALRQILHEFEFNPSYWITMGAASITVLAGSRIVQSGPSPVVDAVRGAAGSISVIFWALATWLIPALVAASWWRHRTRREPAAYGPMLWSMVFPLGMYAVASIYLGKADGLPWIGVIGSAELWVAFSVWAITFAAMAVHLYRTVANPGRAAV